MRLNGLGAVVCALVVLVTAGARADAGPGHFMYRDVELSTVQSGLDKIDDIAVTSANEALYKIRQALDFLYQTSPYSVQQIRKLRENGNVYLIYNPSYPVGEIGGSSIKLAAFMPSRYDRTGRNPRRKDFVVFVGRYGIKRSTEVLARTIVHELVGHGIQHLEGRTAYVRTLDLECEARLYEEKFLQDAKTDKQKTDMIEFRRAMEDHWCSDFNKYLYQRDTMLGRLWEPLNPNVPRLLALHKQYTDEMRRKGSSKVVDRAKEIFKEERGQGKPEDQYMQGLKYLKGMGTPQDMNAAANYFYQAAQQNFADAQYSYGIMMFQGQGMDKDPQTGALWLMRAVQQGHAASQYALGMMYINGTGVLPDRDRGLGLVKQAAGAGYAPAQTVLRRNNITF